MCVCACVCVCVCKCACTHMQIHARHPHVCVCMAEMQEPVFVHVFAEGSRGMKSAHTQERACA